MKTIIVTGASNGIGYATSIELAKQGHQVFAIARTKHKLEALRNESYSGKIIPISADLTKDDGIKTIIANLENIQQIQVLINNAGILVNKPFLETTIQEWINQFDVNVLATVRLIKAIKTRLVEGSHIVNISSMGGYQGSTKFPGLSAYSATKGALSILSECLSNEFAQDRIAVNSLCLGAVQTNMLEEAFPGYKAPTQPSEMAKFISNFSLTAHNYLNGKILPIALNNPN